MRTNIHRLALVLLLGTSVLAVAQEQTGPLLLRGGYDWNYQRGQDLKIRLERGSDAWLASGEARWFKKGEEAKARSYRYTGTLSGDPIGGTVSGVLGEAEDKKRYQVDGSVQDGRLVCEARQLDQDGQPGRKPVATFSIAPVDEQAWNAPATP